MRIDLRSMRDANGAVLPETHPIRKLLKELPWLHGLASVREFFQLVVVLHRDRLTKALETGMTDGREAVCVERELLYLENVARDAEIGGVSCNLRTQYLEARRAIADLNGRIGADKSTARHQARFDLAVAELFHDIRRLRPFREAPRPRDYRTQEIVPLRADDDARLTGS